MPRPPYTTLERPGEAEHVVSRSRFLAYALPVETVEEAETFVAALRKTHHDARHVVYGFRIGHGAALVDRSNDDGEPSRTGGYPAWQLLEGGEVTDALVAIVRYFGGVKLGMGGLARAYREAARLAIEDARVVTRYPELAFDLTVGYAAVDTLQHVLRTELPDVRVLDTAYAADVTFTLSARHVDLEDVRARLGALLQRDPSSIAPLIDPGRAPG
jgi:uncharacterized YigZ family protein